MNSDSGVTRRDFLGGVLSIGAVGLTYNPFSCAAVSAAEMKSVRAIMHKVHQDMQKRVLPELEKAGVQVRISTGPNLQVEEGFVREARVQPRGFDVGFQKPEWYDAARFRLLEPLDEWQRRDPIPDFDDLLPSLVSDGKFQGVQYMIPVRTGGYVIHYRKDLFDEHKLRAPQTMEELGHAARVLNAKAGVYGFTCYGRPEGQWQALHNLAAAYGGQLIDAKGDPVMDSKETVAALEWYAGLFRDKVISPDHPNMDVDGTNRLMTEGRTAMVMELGSRWVLYTDPNRSKVARKLDWIALPPAEKMVGKKIGGYATSWSLVIPKNSANKEIAWRYIKHLSLAQSQVTMAQDGNDPVRRSTWGSKEVLAKYSERGASSLVVATRTALERATSPWPIGTPQSSKIVEIIGDAVGKAMLGSATSQEAMKWAADQVRSLKG